MPADAILDALDPEQREVAAALHGPVCVLAGAGTGKTRAITHRIAYGVRVNAYSPQSVLAVTFTARAAGEMRGRLRELGVDGVQARTFHSAALRQLSYFWPQVVGGSLPRVINQKAPLVGKAAQQVGLSVDRLAVRDLAAEIEWAKVSLIAASDYPDRAGAAKRPAPAGFNHEQMVDVMRAYEDAKSAAVVIDFEDILLLLADVLARHQDVADHVRRQYRHFVVDEYQDVSALQQYLLDQWLGGRDSICVVGDPAQTIYSFAGASPRHLLDFPRTYPEATVVRLVRDYRSTPQVVDAANRLMSPRSANEPGITLVAQRPAGPDVACLEYADDAAEAAETVTAIERLVAAGTEISSIAVLYRTNSQSEAFEDALSRRQVGYVVRGGQRFFDRDEVRKAMVLLRGAAVAEHDRSVAEVVREVVRDIGWSEEAPEARGQVRERWESLQALVALADDYGAESVREFVEHLAERAQAQHAPTVAGVTLSTIHAAKGLEWDAVFVVGVSEGLVPISMAESPEAIEEERRLLYVAMTRAREHLSVSYAKARQAGGRASRKRSRFLDPVWPATARPRKIAADLDPAQAALLAALKQWRLDRSTAAGKPAFTVLVDTSLMEIVTTRPRTLADLARVRGIGATKLEAFGTEVLDIVAAHAEV